MIVLGYIIIIFLMIVLSCIIIANLLNSEYEKKLDEELEYLRIERELENFIKQHEELDKLDEVKR